jgi:uncharacterized protein (TIGR02722 family)
MCVTIKKFSSYVLSAFVLVSLTGCLTTAPTVRYGDSKAVETVTTEFGSTDLQTIAETMARSLLVSGVVADSREAPTVTVAEVRNKTTEYIDTRVITDKIRTQLTRSGKVRFAVSINEMQNQVDELKRQNQTGLYSSQSKTKMGNMTGAKSRVEGAISSIIKQNKNVRDVFFVFNLNLINNETGLVEWADEKEIRKTASR